MRAALIPAYNEESRIAPVILKARRHVDLVIVCDDGSTDMTPEVARDLGAVVVRHGRNLGYGAALRTLFLEALKRDVDVAVTLDADGQHDPDFIPVLVEPVERGEADLVIGSRFVRGGGAPGMSRLRRLALAFLNLVGRRAVGLDVRDTQSGMRAYSRRALEVAADAMERGMGVSYGILREAAKAGLRVKEVPIKVSYGEARPSRNPVLHFSELVAALLRIVLEERPLLYLGIPGLLLVMVGLAFGWWALDLYLSTRYFSVPMALVSVGSSIAGFLLVITSFQLYVLAKLRAELRRLRRRID